MNNFKRGGDRGGDNRSGGFRGGNGGKPSFKPAFQKKSWGGADRGGDKETVMHKATCSHCGKACEVPFRPTGEKPVYCRDCFNRNRDGEDARPMKTFGRGDDFKKSFSKSYEGRSPRPEFARADIKSAPQDDTRQKLADISFKLDVLIKALEKINADKNEATVPTEDLPKKSEKKSLIKKITKKGK